jgi:hypothetical protein
VFVCPDVLRHPNHKYTRLDDYEHYTFLFCFDVERFVAIAANVPGLAKCGYSVIRQPGTFVDFLFKVQDKIFDE